MSPFVPLVAVALLFAAEASASTPCPESDGRTLLEIQGNIACASGSGTATFDIDQLEGLDPVTIRTSTPWTHGVRRFTGVPLNRLLEAAGADGHEIRAHAINNYSVDIPAADLVEDGPIVAHMIDGQTMSVRDKGPLWIVYPWDARDEYQNEATYSRSIWQLNRIEVLD